MKAERAGHLLLGTGPPPACCCLRPAKPVLLASTYYQPSKEARRKRRVSSHGGGKIRNQSASCSGTLYSLPSCSSSTFLTMIWLFFVGKWTPWSLKIIWNGSRLSRPGSILGRCTTYPPFTQTVTSVHSSSLKFTISSRFRLYPTWARALAGPACSASAG